MPTSNPTSAPAATQPVKDTRELQRLFTKMIGGDAAAREMLIDVMRDPATDYVHSQIAITMLGQEGSKASIIALTRMLLSEDLHHRTSAYYAIPEKERPLDFDYTAAPTDETKRVIDEYIAELKRETDQGLSE